MVQTDNEKRRKQPASTSQVEVIETQAPASSLGQGSPSIPGKLGTGIFLLLIGILGIASSYYTLPNLFWHYVINLWPILLVFIGIDVAFGNRPAIRYILTGLAILLGVALLLTSLWYIDPAWYEYLRNQVPWLPDDTLLRITN